jgi:hypothetical protein
MGVDIDKSWCDNLTGRIDFFTTRCTNLANGSDKAAINRNISHKARCTRAINYGSAPNNQIMHVDSPLFQQERISFN